MSSDATLPGLRRPLRPRLATLSGPRAGEAFELTEAVITIGRAPDNTIAIPEDGRLSRYHARFEVRADGLWVTDLGSTNGTLINGAMISGPRRLEDGDQVQTGDTIFAVTLSVPEPAAEANAHAAGTTLVSRAARRTGSPEQPPGPPPPRRKKRSTKALDAAIAVVVILILVLLMAAAYILLPAFL